VKISDAQVMEAEEGIKDGDPGLPWGTSGSGLISALEFPGTFLTVHPSMAHFTCRITFSKGRNQGVKTDVY